jgi:hypothetical protein
MSISSLCIHNHLLVNDQGYADYWSMNYQRRADAIYDTWNSLEKIATTTSREEFEKQFHIANSALQKFFVRVAERELQESRITESIPRIALDASILQHKFEEGMQSLERFIRSCHSKNLILYGGIKRAAAVEFSVLNTYKKRLAGHIATKTDFRDLVRFRIVCPGKISLMGTAIEFWETFFHQIIHCRNYYFTPVGSSNGRPYRGVHFLLCDDGGFPIEVQLNTQFREAACILDHAPIYKNRTDLPDPQMYMLIEGISCAANIMDSRQPK